MEEIVRAFDWLINSGKAFYWGTSEWSAQQLQEAHEVAAKHNLIGPSAEQPHASRRSFQRSAQVSS
jgi:aryl-alcohol dehydrogenase-like predicted oxidoreductase